MLGINFKVRHLMATARLVRPTDPVEPRLMALSYLNFALFPILITVLLITVASLQLKICIVKVWQFLFLSRLFLILKG